MIIIIFNNYAILCDPLNTVQFSHPDVVQTVITFCKNNSLYLQLYGTTIQSQKTNVCGYLVLWLLLKATKLSFLGFLRLKKTILLNNISTNERSMVYTVRQHFKLL